MDEKRTGQKRILFWLSPLLIVVIVLLWTVVWSYS